MKTNKNGYLQEGTETGISQKKMDMEKKKRSKKQIKVEKRESWVVVEDSKHVCFISMTPRQGARLLSRATRGCGR